MPAPVQLRLDLPIPLAGIAAVEPTISMLEGTSRLVQCARCGVAMAVPDCGPVYRHNDRLGPCPRCEHPKWWNENGTDLGPFNRTTEAADFAWDHIVAPHLAGQDR
jgi:hypothetical protein